MGKVHANTKPDGPLTPAGRAAVVAEFLAAGHGCPSALLRHSHPSLVWQAYRFGYGDEDIDSACLEGLARAARKFDPARVPEFATYALDWLRGCVGRMLRLDTRDHERRGGRKLLSGDRRYDSGEGDVSIFDLTVGPDGCPTRPLSAAEVGVAVRASVRLAVPSARYRLVVRLRWGLDGDPPLTLQQVGGLLGMSRERVRQIEAKVVERLRNHLRTLYFDHFRG